MMPFGTGTTSGNAGQATKGEVVLAIGNFLITHMGYAPSNIEEILSIFEDRSAINEAFTTPQQRQIALAVQAGVVLKRTDNNFAPESLITRGDAAVLLHRMYSRLWLK
jgi:hypothetical protein